jgi:hypothetical protein
VQRVEVFSGVHDAERLECEVCDGEVHRCRRARRIGSDLLEIEATHFDNRQRGLAALVQAAPRRARTR